VLEAPRDEKVTKRVSAAVAELCNRHPVYRAAEER